jgi:hypothetical protein
MVKHTQKLPLMQINLCSNGKPFKKKCFTSETSSVVDGNATISGLLPT